MTPWPETTLARAILANSTPDDLYVRWCIDDVQSEDLFRFVGPPVRILQKVLDKHVAEIMGCTLKEAERPQAWIAVYRAQPTVQEVLNERFGNPNTLGLRMPLSATSTAYHAEWDRAFRAQFPVRREAA